MGVDAKVVEEKLEEREEEKEVEDEEEEEEAEEENNCDKSNNPRLAGGEQRNLFCAMVHGRNMVYIWLYYDIFPSMWKVIAFVKR